VFLQIGESVIDQCVKPCVGSRIQGHSYAAFGKEMDVSACYTSSCVCSACAMQGLHETKEAAAYLGVSIRSIRGLIAKDFIRAKRIGKYDVVRREELSGYWERAA